MANKVDTLDASCPIKSAADKFYNFFKFNMNDLVKIFPAGFTGVQLIQGEEGTVGCVKLWSYSVGGVSLSAKVRIEAINDDEKSITFSVEEGDLLTQYKSFKVTLIVSEGLAKWTIAFEKLILITPPPVLYVPLAITASTLVDAYLLIN